MRRYTDKEWAEMSTADRVNIRREQLTLERKAHYWEGVLVIIGLLGMLLGSADWRF